MKHSPPKLAKRISLGTRRIQLKKAHLHCKCAFFENAKMILVILALA